MHNNRNPIKPKNMAQKLYPIGIQGFESLREGGYYYIDKTQYIYQLATTGKVYFLSRPRRFGKSLLISTLEAYFQGKKELFSGLAIERLEKEWEEYPVLHIDLNTGKYDQPDSLDNILNDYLCKWEALYGHRESEKDLALRFKGVIERACSQTGRQVVVLIDEYDKPLLNTIDNEPLQQLYRNTLKAFYGVLKTMDNNIRFALLTGVTKFSHVSVFSDLNNLRDISMVDDYAGICGVTEQELADHFKEDIEMMARHEGVSPEEMAALLKEMYDGYHFSRNSPGIYNPFSLLNAFASKAVGSYWFSTGTPTFLVKLMKRDNYDLQGLDYEKVRASVINMIDPVSFDPVPVLYQSGYLTIKGYDPRFNKYILGMPNREVEEGLIDFLLPCYANNATRSTSGVVERLVRQAEAGDPDEVMRCFQALLADLPGDNFRDADERHAALVELNFRNVMFLVAKFAGLYVRSEYRTATGRVDMAIQTDGFTYLMEFKLNDTAEAALAQINAKDYPLALGANGRRLFKIGVEFSREKRNIDSWLVEE